MGKIKVYLDAPGGSSVLGQDGEAAGPLSVVPEQVDLKAPIQEPKKVEKIALAKSQAAALQAAAKSGAAFCEECEAAKRALAAASGH
jgi:hypothetical protein